MINSKDINILIRWLEIKKENGKDVGFLEQLKCDIDHSALLQRLLEGKEPTEETPPRSYSHPNYDLIEYGFSCPLEVWEDVAFNVFGTDQPCVVIDQFPWRLVEKLGQDNFIVKYDGNENLYRVFITGTREGFEEGSSMSKLWRLELYTK